MELVNYAYKLLAVFFNIISQIVVIEGLDVLSYDKMLVYRKSRC